MKRSIVPILVATALHLSCHGKVERHARDAAPSAPLPQVKAGAESQAASPPGESAPGPQDGAAGSPVPPAAFPLQEDISRVASLLPDFFCDTGSHLFAGPQLMLICTRWKEGTDEILDQFILIRKDGVWDAVRPPGSGSERIMDAQVTGDGTLYAALAGQVVARDGKGNCSALAGKGMKHPVQVWSCGGGRTVATSIDKIEKSYTMQENFWFATMDADRAASGAVRIHVLSGKKDCILPAQAVMPMFLECTAGGEVLHLLSLSKESQTKACGLAVRRHAFTSMAGVKGMLSPGEKLRLFFCKTTDCKEGTRAACIADGFGKAQSFERYFLLTYAGGKMSSTTLGGDWSAVVGLDIAPSCDGEVFSAESKVLENGEWVALEGASEGSRLQGRGVFSDADDVLWTAGTEGIQRGFKGTWETVLGWKEMELSWPAPAP
jgi:hypothetical protein